MVAALATMALAARTQTENRIYVNSEDVASEESLRGLYERWYRLYRPGGDPANKAKRYAIFKAEVRAVYELNEGDTRVKHHLNWFADMSQGEYAEYFANCSPREIQPFGDIPAMNHHQPSRYYPDKLPLTVDWRTVDGVLTSVKQQGNCGSCWAIAAAEAMESVHFLKNKQRTNLSAQELVDCTPNNEGCKGGFASRAFQYVIDRRGIHSSEQYPYVGKAQYCDPPSVSPVMSIKKFYFVQRRNEKMLMDAVAHNPVVVLIVGAENMHFKHYSGGIYRGPCGMDKKHEALLVGYGTTPSDDSNDPGAEYWIVKNSWGDSWGEKGYMRLARGHQAYGGLCGIMLDPKYPSHPKRLNHAYA
jgi:hypothetical protein